METFELIVKKRRWRNRVIIAVLSLLMTVVAMLGAKSLSDYFISKQVQEVMRVSNILDSVAYPNQRIYRWSANGGDYFHGGIKNSWVRDVSGVPVQSNEQEIDFSWTSINWGSTVASEHETFVKDSLYDPYRQQKKGQFYNPKAKSREGESIASPVQEIAYLRQFPNQLVEVYVSFDQPYTLKQIREKIPAKLNQNWYWIGTTSTGDTSTWKDMDLYGIDGDWFSTDPTSSEVKSLAINLQALADLPVQVTYANVPPHDELPVYLSKLDQLTAPDQVTFGGVILTGQTEDFASLENADWIHASSIGTLAVKHPYFNHSGE